MIQKANFYILVHVNESVLGIRIDKVDKIDATLISALALDSESLAFDELKEELVENRRRLEVESASDGESARQTIDQIGRDLAQVLELQLVRIAVVDVEHVDEQIFVQRAQVSQVIAAIRDNSSSVEALIERRYAKFTNLQRLKTLLDYIRFGFLSKKLNSTNKHD